MSTTRTDARIARLEARLTAIDAALAAQGTGIVEQQVDNTRIRMAETTGLDRERASIEAQLSKLYALKDCAGQTRLYR